MLAYFMSKQTSTPVACAPTIPPHPFLASPLSSLGLAFVKNQASSEPEPEPACLSLSFHEPAGPFRLLLPLLASKRLGRRARGGRIINELPPGQVLCFLSPFLSLLPSFDPIVNYRSIIFEAIFFFYVENVSNKMNDRGGSRGRRQGTLRVGNRQTQKSNVFRSSGALLLSIGSVDAR